VFSAVWREELTDRPYSKKFGQCRGDFVKSRALIFLETKVALKRRETCVVITESPLFGFFQVLLPWGIVFLLF